MRDYALFLAFFGMLPFILKRPVIGLLVYAFFSLMNPHRLTYGSAYDFPFAAIIAAVTLISVLLTPQEKRLPKTPVTMILILFFCWMTFTSIFALEPHLVWAGWEAVMKTFLMMFLTMAVVKNEKEIKNLALVLALSLGFYGVKGGIFTIMSGGVNRVHGPTGTYIADNNDLALALLISIPILWFVRLYAPAKWLRITLTFILLLTVIAVIGTYSRGALLAGLVMLLLLWVKSSHKLQVGLLAIITIPIGLLFMPEKWMDRMSTISEYDSDASALGRINAWEFAINLALDRFIGGGFNVFTPNMFHVYAPDPLDFHVAHSIYFRVLGEHGFVGLGLFLLLIILTWKSANKVIKLCKNKLELKWASDLAAMTQVSIIGYAVGGAFLSLSYYDLFYYIVALIFLLEKIIVFQELNCLSSPYLKDSIKSFESISIIKKYEN